MPLDKTLLDQILNLWFQKKNQAIYSTIPHQCCSSPFPVSPGRSISIREFIQNSTGTSNNTHQPIPQ